MSTDLPEYYFRVRENGAAVFRVDTNNRHRRIEMDQIAIVNTRNGEVKPQGGALLSKADQTAIADWMMTRTELLKNRALDDIARTIDHMNLTTQWAQSRASDTELDAITDELLLAMHDLRTILVRKKADRLSGATQNG